MDQVQVREVNAEVIIFLEKNYPTRLSALQEASRILNREVIRYEAYIRSHDNRES